VTTPIVNDRAATSRDGEIYEAPREVATRRDLPPPRQRGLYLLLGATLGIVFWLLLFTLGIPWVFHIGGFDGLLPSALAGAVLGLTRWRLVPLAGVVVLSLVLLVVAYTPIIAGPAHSLIRNDPLPRSADAIMVLSAGTNDDGTLSSQALDRLLSGLELFNRGVAPVLMVSREAYIVGGHIVTSRRDQERIVSLSSGALAKLVVVGITHSTHDEAIRARDVFRANRWKRIVLVTSPFHTRRACGTFEQAGVVVSCAASDSRDMAVRELSAPDDRVRAFQIWIYEVLGSIRYRQLGWL
jgi:uncharacterized SAM-binding protein YcdF (DUF218 family)